MASVNAQKITRLQKDKLGFWRSSGLPEKTKKHAKKDNLLGREAEAFSED